MTEKQQKFAKFAKKILKKFDEILLNFRIRSGAKECRSCRSRKMRKNASTLAIVAVHTEENRPNSAELKISLVKLINIENYLQQLFRAQDSATATTLHEWKGKQDSGDSVERRHHA